jgi:hypothetical protein
MERISVKTRDLLYQAFSVVIILAGIAGFVLYLVRPIV